MNYLICLNWKIYFSIRSRLLQTLTLICAWKNSFCHWIFPRHTLYIFNLKFYCNNPRRNFTSNKKFAECNFCKFVMQIYGLNLLIFHNIYNLEMDPSGLSYAQRVIEHNFEPEASAFQWSITSCKGSALWPASRLMVGSSRLSYGPNLQIIDF